VRICVSYPVTHGHLVLRTDRDWERDVLPSSTSATEAWFDVEMTTPSLELKPCLREGDAIHWACGPNSVLTRHESNRELWPFFFSDERGRVSDVMPIAHEGCVHAVRVYHPPGYDENTLRRFPVLYMQDGANLFSPEDAFGGREWRVDETMDLIGRMNLIQRCLVVGIAPEDREREYTRPGYDRYGRFVVEKLKPLIDAKLRTRREPSATVVMGSSLGGVAALHLAWKWPEVFGRVACLSSTFGLYDDLLERISVDPKRPLLIYLDSGWPMDNFAATNAMRDLLLSRGYRLGVDLLHFSFPDGVHAEDSWAARLHLPFQFFLGRSWLAHRQT